MTARQYRWIAAIGVILATLGLGDLHAGAGLQAPAAVQKAAPAASNAVGNPSFEQIQGEHPAGWDRRTYAGQARFQHARSGRAGEHCVSVASRQGADAGWFASARVRPFSRYRLAGWIKTQIKIRTMPRDAQSKVSIGIRELRNEQDTQGRERLCADLLSAS